MTGHDPAPTVESLLVHTDWVDRLARRLVVDPNAAADVAQSAWLEVLERPPRHPGSVRGFLATVVRNAARRRARGEARRALRERDVSRPERVAGASDVVERASLQRDLVDRVLDLDEPYRTVVLLRFFEELSTTAIAARLKRPRNTVQVQLQRGLERLRAKLDEEYGDRTVWGIAFLPLARGPRATEALATKVSVATAFGGGLVLLKGLALMSVTALASVWMWNQVAAPTAASTDEARSVEPSAEFVAADVEPAPAPVSRGAEREAVALATSPAPRDPPAPRFVGRVVDLRGDARRGVEVAFTRSDAPTLVDGMLWYDYTGVEFRELARDLTEEPEALDAAYPHIPAQFHAGLLAWVDGRDPDWVLRAVSDVDGRFELPVRGEDGAFSLSESLLSVGWGARMRPDGETERLLIVAEPVSVTGLVVDERGMPVEGADVSAGFGVDGIPGLPFEIEADSSRSWNASSDRDGRFDLGRLPRATWYRVSATKRGFRSDSAFLPEAPPFELRLELAHDPDRLAVSGRVFRANGSPAPEVSVDFGQDSTVTDRDGNFELVVSSLRRGASLAAYEPGYEPGFIRGLADAMDVDRTSRSGLLVRLGPPTTSLAGTVTDAGGTPLDGIVLSLFDPTVVRDGSDWFPEVETVVSNAAGRFRFDELSQRPYRVRVVDEDALRTFVTDPIEPGGEVSLAFPASEDVFELRGRVVDPLGTPVGGAQVVVSIVKTRWFWSSGFSTDYLDVDEASTAGDGSFSFSAVPSLAEVQISGDGIEREHFSPDEIDRRGGAQEFEVKLWHRFRFVTSVEERDEEYEFHGPNGALVFKASYPDVTFYDERRRLGEFPSDPLLEVPAEATSLVLFDRDEEIQRIPIQGARGVTTAIVLD